jgi:addiction module HigA family antidote
VIITREDLDAGRVDLSDLVDPEAEPIGPIHPGEVLREDFLAELDMSAYALAKALNVPLTRIAAIVNGERAITADTALRLARYFGTTPAFWLGLQAVYDLEVTKADHGAQIEREVHPRAA